MKKIVIISSIITILFAAMSCEDKEWQESDVELTQVYFVSDIQWSGDIPYGIDMDGTNPYAYEIYQTKPLLIAFKTALLKNARAMELSNYTDSSTDSLYNISFTAQYELTITSLVDGEDVEEDTVFTKDFTIAGFVSSDSCTVNITEQDSPSDTTTTTFSYDALITADEVYN